MSLDNLSVEDFLKALKLDPNKPRTNLAPTEEEFGACGNKVALIAPPGAGKTVTVSGLFMRAQAKVKQSVNSDSPFYARILEKGSDIHQDISNLMDGIFPAKTQAYLGFRSSPGMLLEQKKFLGTGRSIFGAKLRKQLWHKMPQLPICDLPGETLTQVMWQVRAQTGYQAAETRGMIEHAIKEMRSSDAYIFILKASTAKGLGEQIEQEKDRTVSRDPDVNVVRMLEDVANHKMKQGNQMRAAYIVISAVDKIQVRAERLGFDLLSPTTGQRDIENFVANCFPQFYAALHSYHIQHIKYYPMFFETVKDDKKKERLFEDTIEYRKKDGSFGIRTVYRPHIIVKDLFDPETRNIWQNARKISYSEEYYDNLLNDLMELARSR